MKGKLLEVCFKGRDCNLCFPANFWHSMQIDYENKFRIDAYVIDLIWKPNKDFNLNIQPKRSMWEIQHNQSLLSMLSTKFQ